VVDDVSLVEPDDIVEDVSLLLVLLEVLGDDEVVPLAPMLEVLLSVVLEPLAPMLDVLGVVLELAVFAFAPPWPPAEAPADEPVPAAEPEPLDWATATPPMARAAVATSVVRIFLDMSWTP
jgi:hypothetical protein